MRILLIDETAAAERFSSDQSQNVMIGSGVGSGRLTTGSGVFANASALIASLRSQPISVKPSSGNVTVGWQSSTFVSTVGGKIPVYTLSADDVNDVNDGAGSCVTQNTPKFSVVSQSDGQFEAFNSSDSLCGALFGSGSEDTFYCYI